METKPSEEEKTGNEIELEAFGLSNQEFVELDAEGQERLTAYNESLQSAEKAKGDVFYIKRLHGRHSRSLCTQYSCQPMLSLQSS